MDLLPCAEENDGTTSVFSLPPGEAAEHQALPCQAFCCPLSAPNVGQLNLRPKACVHHSLDYVCTYSSRTRSFTRCGFLFRKNQKYLTAYSIHRSRCVPLAALRPVICNPPFGGALGSQLVDAGVDLPTNPLFTLAIIPFV